MKKTYYLLLMCILFTQIALCNINISHFPGKNPGEVKLSVSNNSYKLSNKALSAVLEIKGGSIILEKFENKYDSSTFDMSNSPLFIITLKSGVELSNLDFKLINSIDVKKLNPTDSLPTPALLYKGVQLAGEFKAKGSDLIVEWKAELRDESNYLRQSINIVTENSSVAISEVGFFDMKLDGACYYGSVLGAPIVCKNTFFAMEHPIAHSKALSSCYIGGLNAEIKDVSDIVKSAGEYVVGFETLLNNLDYNIVSMSLLCGDEIVDKVNQTQDLVGGASLCSFTVENYNSHKPYKVAIEFDKPEETSGALYMYKKNNDIINFSVQRQDTLDKGESITESSVIGVTPENQLRRGFQYYLDRERAKAYKPFLHYNSWWDISFLNEINSNQLIDCMNAWNDKFIEPYGVKMNSFVFDDGWDDLDNLWFFNKKNFPDGFTPQAELCKKFDSGIGVWMSPFGGYDPRKPQRIATAKRDGLETNSMGLSLAGKNYYNRFLERSLDMLENYKVNYFKYDGFGGSEPQYLPDMENGMRLISKLRGENPDVYINITVGSWPSPFWLKYADCIWRSSGDMGQSGDGNSTQKTLTYAYGTLYNNIVKRSPLYPINSVMTCALAYANMGHGKEWVADDIKGFKDMVRMYLAFGSSLQEMYISHSRMDKAKWDVLAETAKWSHERSDVLVDTHWIGGSPINLDVYGAASWSGNRGVMCLRNPSKEAQEFAIDLNKVLELQDSEDGDYILKSPWVEDFQKSALEINSNNVKIITLAPFEMLVWNINRK